MFFVCLCVYVCVFTFFAIPDMNSDTPDAFYVHQYAIRGGGEKKEKCIGLTYFFINLTFQILKRFLPSSILVT